MQRDGAFSAGRIDDLIGGALGGGLRFTPFVDPAAAHEISRICGSIKLEHNAFGGYEGAERRIVAVGDGAKSLTGGDFPLETLLISWDKRYGSPAHHDILGAVMALGVKRETFGDILVSDEKAYIFASRPMARAISMLTSAGRANVHVEPCELADIEPPAGKMIKATFKSFRLDAVIAQAMRLPRPAALRLIEQGKVFLNYAPCMKPDARIESGDLISVRGMGRIVIGAEGGRSKKDRAYLSMEVYSREGK